MLTPIRAILKDWRFAAMVILTLTVCVGANTALFTIVNSVLLQPLPVPEADRILLMANAYPKAEIGREGYSGGADYYDRLRDIKVFEEQALFKPGAQTMDLNGSPERVQGMYATPSLFRLLRVAPTLGRLFTDNEGEYGAEQKVILSYAFWQKLYAGDHGVLGRELRLNSRPYTIVGVMPRDFLFVDPAVRFWVPLALTPEQEQGRHSNNWYNIGRLKPAATLAQAQAQVNALNAANLERFPQWTEVLKKVGFYTKVEPLKEYLIGDIKGTLYLLWGGAAFVLLIGAVNIANLALARTTVRMKEFATRLALGASQGQIIRQLLVENLVIALAGGLAGLGLGAAILRILQTVGLDRLPRASEVHISGLVVLFTLAIAAIAGVGIAILPLSRIFNVSLTAALRENSRTGSGSRHSRFARQSLVVAQIGFAFVLLAGAGLLLASFRQLTNVDPGFKTNGIVTATTSLPPSRYPTGADRRGLMSRSLDAIRAIPGVISAGATTGVPFSGEYSDSVILPEGYTMRPGQSIVSPMSLVATPGYMETMNIGLVRGRYFDARDTENSPRVAIIDERLAHEFWPDSDPTGRRMFPPSNPDFTKTDAHTVWITVVGVVRTVRLGDLSGAGNAAGTYYFPYAQTPQHNFMIAVAAKGDQSALSHAVRAAMAGVDPELALFDVKSMTERKELSLSSRKTSMSIALAFGGLALFLSAIGIYSVLSYLLGQRRREIGIRLAVGSSPSGIFLLFFREGLVLIGTGLLAGIVGAAALRKAVENQIYGVQPLDPLVISLVTAVLGGIALAACLRPAQRAMQVDPVVVLNEQ